MASCACYIQKTDHSILGSGYDIVTKYNIH